MRLFRLLSLVLALGLAPASVGASNAAVALLPFESLSSNAAAAADLAPLVASGLRSRGWTVVEGAVVEAALDAAQVRYLDSIASDVRAKVAATAGAQVLALGAVYAYDAGADPRVALAMRLVSADGTVLFSDLVALRAEDREGLFTFGETVTREDLAQEAVRRLCRRLPSPGASPAAIRKRTRPFHVAPVQTYRSAALATRTRHRIAVLPFANAGPHEAALIVAEIFARRLPGSTLFDLVEPADFRNAFVAEKIRDMSDPAELRRLGQRLGTTLFLTGTIYEFTEPVQAGSDTPRLEMEATLTDVATGEIVWTSYASRRGTDYRGLLELGAITSIVGLADQSAAEMIHAVEKTAPATGPRPGREAHSRAQTKESR